ncbi:MAG: alpha/beta hydrolase [Alteromonadaceae bacterium]|nr:alpha/beta hydrolase [Alteromonadaceae bacterium]
MLREGNGEPVVLFHGVTCSERVWAPIAHLLSPHCEVFAPTSMGHRGGAAARPGVKIADLVDDAEATLDQLKLDRPHLVGNSLGGWIAMELARRGRASSVCALSPAGCWDVAKSGQRQATDKLKGVVRLTRATRWALPLASRLGVIRKFAMRENAVNGARVSSQELISMADDLLGCTAKYDLLNTTEAMAPLKPAPCPVLLAWAEFDRIFPPEVNGPIARELIPDAEWRVLPKVGHLPMLDDPELVAKTIIDWVNAHSLTKQAAG